MQNEIEKIDNQDNDSDYETEYFVGPLPHPEVLKKYEQILPGAADRIIKLAEHQLAHRQDIEKQIIKSNIESEKRGINFAFLLAIVLMLIGALLVYERKDTAGYFALFGPLIYQGISFFIKKSNDKKELEKKDQEIDQDTNQQIK